MNLTPEMIPGLCALIVGAVLTFGAEKLAGKKKNVPQLKLIGVGVAAIGAIMIFWP